MAGPDVDAGGDDFGLDQVPVAALPVVGVVPGRQVDGRAAAGEAGDVAVDVDRADADGDRVAPGLPTVPAPGPSLPLLKTGMMPDGAPGHDVGPPFQVGDSYGAGVAPGVADSVGLVVGVGVAVGVGHELEAGVHVAEWALAGAS